MQEVEKGKSKKKAYMYNELCSITQMQSVDEGTPSAAMQREGRGLNGSSPPLIAQSNLMNIEEEEKENACVDDFDERLKKAEEEIAKS